MAAIIVAISGKKTSERIIMSLTRSGYPPDCACRSGAFLLRNMDRLQGGIVIVSQRLSDMSHVELFESLDPSFFMLVLGGEPMAGDPGREGRIRYLSSPIKFIDILEEIRSIEDEKQRQKKVRAKGPRKRTVEEERLIEGAKLLLMHKEGMTENEAHIYLRKKSMESGDSLKDTAEKIRILYGV